MNKRNLFLWCPIFVNNGEIQDADRYAIAAGGMREHLQTLGFVFIERYIQYSKPANAIHRTIYEYGWLFIVDCSHSCLDEGLLNELWLSVCQSAGCYPMGGSEVYLTDSELLTLIHALPV